MRVILIGAVSSSLRTLEKLIEHKFDVVTVFGHEPAVPEMVSGIVNLRDTCKANDIEYYPFRKINDHEHVKVMKEINPDVIFAVGFSQLISSDILSIPALGCIGFHPTKLPEGRGRAPVAWLVLEEMNGAATFFLMGQGADDGPIFIQSQFDVDSKDTAKSLQVKILDSIDKALDAWLPDLKAGLWNPTPQNEDDASWFGKRNHTDGLINWEHRAVDIDSLIRATTQPYPGAFTFYKDNKLTVWESSLENNLKIKGVIGRVLLIRNSEILVQTGEGLIWITHYQISEGPDKDKSVEIKVGEKLGYNSEYEIFKLKKLVRNL